MTFNVRRRTLTKRAIAKLPEALADVGVACYFIVLSEGWPILARCFFAFLVGMGLAHLVSMMAKAWKRR